MPLYIRDDSVDELAVRLQNMTSANNKTEAVRKALKDAIERHLNQVPLHEKIAAIQQARRNTTGPIPVDFDMKSFTDDGWEN